MIPTQIQISLLAVALYVTSAGIGEADPRHISLMPDPHGEFIRLCAPFQTSRYAHPEGVCECLWSAVYDRIDDPYLMDAILYGIMERGVPSIDAAALPPSEKHEVDLAYSALAEPTLECFFGQGAAKRPVEHAITPTSPMLPPVQDLSP